MDKPRRARTVQELDAIHERCFPDTDSETSLREFRPRPTDIIITPYSKCGTTWLQQTFHTLRTRGDMAFDDISRVVPWIETARTVGLDINAEQKAEPRGFKSHLPYDQVPKGARYVVCFRDPRDAMVSLYRFFEGWFFEPGAISLAEFAAMRLSRRTPTSGYWHHLISWWQQRDNPDVLLFSYERMSREPRASIRKLAAFCGMALDDDLLELTLENSSLDFMLKHKDKFDDLLNREVSERVGNIPAGSDSSKVRTGRVGAHREEMPVELSAMLDAVWAETVTPQLGFHNYGELESAMAER